MNENPKSPSPPDLTLAIAHALLAEAAQRPGWCGCLGLHSSQTAQERGLN